MSLCVAYAFDGARRKTIDFGGLFRGRSCFLVCPGPSLRKHELKLLNHPNVFTVGVNNSSVVVEELSGSNVNVWIGCDRSQCFLKRILLNPKIMKFSVMKHNGETVQDGVCLKDCPSMFFIDLDTNMDAVNFCESKVPFVWWRNTLTTAIQLCYRLGFSKVYLIGSEMKIGRDCRYAHPSTITDEEIAKNARLYEQIASRIETIRDLLAANGTELFNCSGGLLEESGTLPSVSFENAVKSMTDGFPESLDTSELPHCSRVDKTV